MKFSALLILIALSGISRAQPDCILIELEIFISDQETGVPTPDAQVILVRDDGVTFKSGTDACGRISVNDSTLPGFMEVEHTYTLEVEGKLKQYLGSSDAFTTAGIVCNTRIIRDLKVVTMYRCRMYSPEITFPENSAVVDDAVLQELRSVYGLLIHNPTVVIEVAGMYDSANEQKITLKRATVVYQKLLEMGIPKERLVMRTWARPLPAEDNWTYPGFDLERAEPDVKFLILSFDYKPSRTN